MKKVIEVSIGGINFTMEDDAYYRLKEYLRRFEETISDKKEAREVMEDVEARVAEIFQKEMKFSNQVVDMKLVQVVIDHLGEVEPKPKMRIKPHHKVVTIWEKSTPKVTKNSTGTWMTKCWQVYVAESQHTQEWTSPS